MNYRATLTLTFLFFLTGCSPFSKEAERKIIADGLTPKLIYQEAKKKEKSGTLEQAIDQYESNFRGLSRL